MPTDPEFAVLKAFRESPGTGSLRYAKRPDGSISIGQELCIKLPELPAHIQEALLVLAQHLSTPRFEVVCVGPNCHPDRVYIYRRILSDKES